MCGDKYSLARQSKGRRIINMEATPKATGIEELLTAITGRDRKACIANDICTTCGGNAGDFRDFLSAKEYTISGMCQTCQDIVFMEAEKKGKL